MMQHNNPEPVSTAQIIAKLAEANTNSAQPEANELTVTKRREEKMHHLSLQQQSSEKFWDDIKKAERISELSFYRQWADEKSAELDKQMMVPGGMQRPSK